MPAKHSSGSGKMQGKGMQRAQRSAANPGIMSAKSKVDKGEPLTVGRMLKNVKDKLAGLRTNNAEVAHNSAASTVVDLAKKREAKKAQKKPTNAPTLKQSLKKKSGSDSAGFDSRAENANVRSITKQTGRKGRPAQPPLDDVGARHH
jgi:hypothetical protein